jgi:hypothetical protein
MVFYRTHVANDESAGSDKQQQHRYSWDSRQRRRQGSGQVTDVLSPFNHQRFAVSVTAGARIHAYVQVLFGSYSALSQNAPVFCVRPWVVWMQFYGLHDMTLGEFLSRYVVGMNARNPINMLFSH